MCGINGVVFHKGVQRSQETLILIKFLFDELMVQTQSRGEHATGLVEFKRDGSYLLHKAAVNAVKITTKDEVYSDIVNGFDDNTSVVIGHTRYYTKGKPDNNSNNHPFDIGNIVGVHNGSVANDDYLFTQNKDNFKRQAEVDSEIVYQLINHHSVNAVNIDTLKEALVKNYMRGLFALAFADKRDPLRVHIIKQDKPMSFAHWPAAGITIFNSEEVLITNAFAAMIRMARRMGITLDLDGLKLIPMDRDTYLTVNADAEPLAAGQKSHGSIFSVAQKIYISSSSAKSYYTGKGSSATGSAYPVNVPEKTGCGSSAASKTAIALPSGSVFRGGRVIEGMLDEETNEIIIFSPVESTSGCNI